MHGGRAKQVQNRARERLDEIVMPAIAELRRLVKAADTDSVKLGAIKDVLDRTGYKLPERIESDNATTIRVEYENLEVPLQAPRTAESVVEQHIEHVNGSYTNGTSKHD